MQAIASRDRLNIGKNLILFLVAILISFLTLGKLGVNGLYIIIAVLSFVIIAPVLYNKPTLFLFVSLIIYPLTRFFSLEDKFIITGGLYILSFPAFLFLIDKYLFKITKNSYYIGSMIFLSVVILLNLLRPNSLFIEVIKDFGRIYYAVFIIFAVHNYCQKNPENISKLTYYLSYLMNFMVIIAIGQYITKIGGLFVNGFYRVRGTFFNFNDYAFIISIFICFCVCILLNSNNFKSKIYWSITIFLNLLALILTFSKTSMLNTVLIFLLMSLFLPVKRKIQLWISFLILGLLFFSILVLSGTFDLILNRFYETKSLNWRFEMWRTLYSLIIQGNLLVGQGANASREFLAVFMPAGESTAPHNIYLEMLYNYGLFGLIPFILIFVFTLLKGVSLFFENNFSGNPNKIVGISIIIISLIVFVQNFVSNAYYDRAVNIILWIILSLLICWSDFLRNNVQENAFQSEKSGLINE